MRPRLLRLFASSTLVHLILATTLLTAVSCTQRSTLRHMPPTSSYEEGIGEGRERWLRLQRAYPFGDVDLSARQRAWDAVRGEMVATASGQPRWEPAGPAPTQSAFPLNWGPTSGRVRAVAIAPNDPNVVLIGASSGGIWRSSDGGTTFAPVTDNHVDLSVSSIAFAPSNPSIVYAAMGSDFLGTGILKSTDGGRSWQRISLGPVDARGSRPRILVHAANPDTVYLAQRALQVQDGNVYSSGLHLSVDGGRTWSMRLRGLVSDIDADPLSPSTLYATFSRVDEPGGLPPGIYRSIDGGQTWMFSFGGSFAPAEYPRFNIAVARTSPGVVYAHGAGSIAGQWKGRMFQSSDYGLTWREVAATGLPFADSEYLEAHPTRSGILFLGRFMDLYRSDDHGATWMNLTNNQRDNGSFAPDNSSTHPDQCALAFAPNDPNVILIGTDGGLYHSNNLGATFTPKNASLSLTQIYRMTADPANAARVYVGTQDNGLQMRAGRLLWRELITGDYGNPILFGPDRSTVLVNYIYGNIFRLSNHGEEWDLTSATNETFGESTSPRVAFIAPLEAAPDGTVFFASWKLFSSSDRGTTWRATAETDLTKGGRDVITAIGLSTDGNVIYTGSSKGRVMMSVDRGATWKDVTTGLPNRFVTRILVDPILPTTAYVSVSGYRTDHVFRTTTGGVVWERFSSGLPDVPVNALLLDRADSRVLYAGTDIGVFRCNPAGAWEYFGNGMPPVVVTDLDYAADGTLLAATHGRGVYEYGKRGRTRPIRP